MCFEIPNFANFTENKKEILLKKIKLYYKELPVIVETFALNQLQGTPHLLFLIKIIIFYGYTLVIKIVMF